MRFLTRQTIFLIGLFFSSLVLRLLFFWYYTHHGLNAWIYVDSDQYLAIARHLVAGNGFCFDAGVLQAYRLPGYPLFIAFCFKVFGVHVLPVLLLQIMLASFIPLLTYAVCRTLFPARLRCARIAGIIACIHPGFIIYAGMLATESLTIIMLLLFFYYFFRIMRMPYDVHVLFYAPIAGICLGGASLFRPIGHYALMLALIMLLFAAATTRQKFYAGTLLVAGWLLCVLPWLIRNYVVFGGLFFHTLPGMHFLQYSAAHVVTQAQHCSYVQARRMLLDEWNDHITNQEQSLSRPLNEYERCCIGQSLAFSYLYTHPWYFCKHACIEVFKSVAGLYSAIILLGDGAQWPDYGSRATWWTKVQRFVMPSVQRPLLRPFIYFDILFLFLMLLGFLLFLIKAVFDMHARYAALLMLPFIMLFIGLTLAYGGARLRMPADPLIVLGAVYGWRGKKAMENEQ